MLARALLLASWRSKQTVLHMFEGANDLKLSLLCFYLLRSCFRGMEGPVRTPVQQLNDYLYSQFIILGVVGGNKRFNCKNCLHNFSGHRSSETASLWRLAT